MNCAEKLLMSMSEMLKGVHAAVDAHERAFDEAKHQNIACDYTINSELTEQRSWEAAIDAHHQKTINLARQAMEKLDKQLDQLDITLGEIQRDVINPEDRSKMKAVRKYIYNIYEKTEELVERI